MMKMFGIMNPTMNMYMTYDTLLGSSNAGAQLKLSYHKKGITHNYSLSLSIPPILFKLIETSILCHKTITLSHLDLGRNKPIPEEVARQLL